MKYPPYKYILAAVDLLALNLAFLVSVRLHTHLSATLFTKGTFLTVPEILFFMMYSVAALFIFQHNNLYKINVFLTIADQTARIVKAIFYVVLGLALLSFFTKSHIIIDSRLVLLYFSALGCIFLVLFRVILFRGVFLYLAKNKVYRRRLLIVGAGHTGLLLAANLSERKPFAFEIVGFLDDERSAGSQTFKGLRVLGRTEEVKSWVDRLRVDEIVICLDNANHEKLIDIVDRCRKTEAVVKISSPLYDIVPKRLFTEKYGDVPVIGVVQSSPSRLQVAYKFIFDFVFSLLGLIVLSPVFLVVAILIKVDSRGPVFFRQIRIGKDGKPFVFYKFRSMYVGSDNEEDRKHITAEFIRRKGGNGEGLTKIVDESKVTRVGRFLRKTSIDELPQLLNVLKGEMSLVGPRPCLPYEWECYEDWHKKRLSVTPGCTGVWQVSGRSAVGFEDMVILDLYYIQNASPLLDLQLILKTIPVMILGKGAK